MNVDINWLNDEYTKRVPLINPEFEFISIKELRSDISKHVISILHKPCGRIIDIIFANFRYRKNCKYCDGHYYDTQSFINRFNKRKDSTEYTILSEYKSISEYMEVRHNKCGKTFIMRADTLIYGDGKCPCIFGKYSNHHSFDLLNRRIQEKDNEYELYKVDKDPIAILSDHVKLRHKTCGTIFTTIPHNFLSSNNKRCPVCKVYPKNLIGYKDSNGVKIIEKWIRSKKIFYEREKTFKDLVSPTSGRKLRYDFYIPDLNLIIEFDGKQHYDTRVSSLFTEDKYKQIRLHDKIKNKYCERHKINLIRIKYMDSSEDYIYNKLNKFFDKEIRVYRTIDYNKIE